MSHAHGILSIDLSAIAHNWSSLAARAPGAQCAAVIKANAYGLGVEKVAQRLVQAGCTQFFVATVPEALEVRACLPANVTVYVLQGFTCSSEQQACIQSRLVPVLVHHSMAEQWLADEDSRQAPCALKVNTGMNRLGVSLEELHALVAHTEFPKLNLVLLMSHLACADEPKSAFNHTQLSCFKDALASVRSKHPKVAGSLANSAGVLLGADYHFDLVRPGIALYGGQPSMSSPMSELRPVVSLRLPVIQVHRLKRGESVGYGRTFVATRDSVVATLASGYAEGLMRVASNRAQAWFNGPVPLVGRISMDSCAVDVTLLSEDQRPAVGDYVEVLGEHIGVDNLAWHAETIGYEVLTSLSGRLERQYLG